jgi:carbonic anhydrase/acetyltransferase-like protein (isoleucine patch superfamily)
MFKRIKTIPNCFIADDATVIGNVSLGEGSSIWFKTVVRGDINTINIGRNTNIQDGAVIHVSSDAPTIIGDSVTIGHRAIIHGCTVGSNTLIGMGAIIMDHAVIGENCIIGAGTLIVEEMEVPPRTLVVGTPGKWVRRLTNEEIEKIKKSATRYVELWQTEYTT